MNVMLYSPILVATAFAACKSSSNEPAVTRGDPGALVRLSGGSVSVGFAEGRLRGAATLEAFSISKHPVTVQQFKSCVAAGVCRWSDASCVNPEGGDTDVALCVGFESAATYCGWVGGRLPTLAEWMLAARGPTVRRFPWGETEATCEQHPDATRAPSARSTFEEAEYERENGYCGLGLDPYLATGEHPAGASEAGMEDILLSSGELVRGGAGSPISACLSEGSGCVVFGLLPGGIDAAERVAPGARSGPGAGVAVGHPYGFRCVSNEEGL